MTRKPLLIVLTMSLAATGLAGQALAVGHYELVWFRQWDRSECGSNHVFQVWVFDEDGERMGSVEIRDHNGAFRGWYTSPAGERCEIELLEEDIGVQCYDGSSTSDVTPVVTTRYGGDWGHYCYEAGFVFKSDGDNPGDADSNTWGIVPTRTNGSNDNPYTKSMVYSHQYWPNYWDPGSEGLGSYGTPHSQTFVATNVNRIMGVFMFAVQSGNDPTQWRAEIHEGGPEGPIIFSKTTPFQFYFGQPLAFGVNDCIVTPGETYTVTLVPVNPPGCNVYLYRGTNYFEYAGYEHITGQYYYQGTPNPSQDLFGFVYGWDAGIGTHGMLRGTVTDTNSNPLQDAVVTVTDEGTSMEVGSKLTSASGEYLFVLPAGTYTVDVSKPGFASGQATGLLVIPDQTTIQDFVLSPLVQELSNYSFEMGSAYAWSTYGDIPPEVWSSYTLGVPAKTGSYWLGTVYPDGDHSISGGAYQRVPAIPGEDYQALYNCHAGSGGGLCRIGVDTAGGTDPNDVSVQWSPLDNDEVTWSDDNDPNFRVEFTATGSHVTVFVEFYTVPTTSVVAVDDVRLFRITGPAPSADRTFSDGWSLISAPLVDSAGDPVTSVLDEVIAAGNSLNGNLFRYNTAGSVYQSYSGQFTNIDQARGYWMNLFTGATETNSGDLPSDPVSMSLTQGWNLIGQPHRYGTPLAGLLLTDGQVPAWHDDINDGKYKYRSDNGSWVWQEDAETAIEWRVYVNNTGSDDEYPRLRIRDAAQATISYDERKGWWKLDDYMTRTSGGVEVAPGEWAILAAPNTWHTVRFYYNDTTLQWTAMIDGLTDDLHYMEGTVSGNPGGKYVQWGVLSSDKYADFYTSYVYWGQNAEIDNWPTSKKYDANPNGPEIASGPFPGWDGETGGSYSRSYSSVGTIEKSVPEAAEAGWVEAAAVGYEDGYQIVTEAGGDDTSMRAWYGYWLKVNQSGLTLKMPGPAEATDTGGDVVSRVKLLLAADGCITSSFAAGMASGASDGYEATHDVTFPPEAPSGTKEVRFGTTLTSDLIVMDLRPEPLENSTKVWSCSATPVNFSPSECKQVTVTWDLSDGGIYAYELVDLGQGFTRKMRLGGEYTFDICEGQQLAFELRARQGCPALDYDGDGDVDEDDVNHFQDCATGPGIPQTDPGCVADADLDNDGDVDQSDFGLFQECYSGPGPQ